MSASLPPFEDVVAAHGPTVLRVCRAILGPKDADDAWSDTFLSALRAYPALRPGSNVEAWLVTIAHRKAIDHTRARARRPLPIDPLPDCPAPSEEDRWDEDLWAAMQALPLKQRLAVAYHYVAGLPYAEVAALIGGSEDAARRAHEPREPEGSDLFVPLPAIAEETIRTLHARLVREAQTDGLLDVAYRTIDSPVGPLLLAATARGLARVAYECEDHDQVLERLARDLSPRILHAPARLDDAAREIDEYFGGLRQGFDLPLDLSLARGFRRLVLTRLREIGYGQTDSYGAVALAVGHPKAVRAVGSACATNPVPVVVPCHRVVRSDGSLGQYVGGVAAKRALLALETAA